jgi:integrase
VGRGEWIDHGLVFANTTGGPLYGRYVTNTMKRLMNEAGLEPRRFHDLRHTSATLMLVMGVPLETIQETLGHASFRTTKDIYGHVLPSMQREAADRMGAFLRGEA